MAIYVDVSSAVHAKAGIGRYSESLARALVAEMPGRFALFFNGGRRAQPLPGLESVPRRTVHAGYKPWRMAVWLGQLTQVGFNRLMPGVELFHATEHLLPPLRHIPCVLTVHDMIFRLFPEHQKRLNYWYLNATMPLYCRRADAIITVSQSSKRDIVESYGLDPAKITVIYEAASSEFVPAAPSLVAEARSRYGLPERFLLHVGTIEPRKNLVRLIEALEDLSRGGLRIPLVVVGAKGWLYDAFFARLEESGLSRDVLFPGYVPQADLPILYSAATAAVTPSVYEGFGLPVLEAMACGTPVVCSNASSLPEVGGEAAEYFDPYDVADMSESIRRVWDSHELRLLMGQRGLEQAAGFSWKRAAQRTLAVYYEALGEAL